MADWKTTKNTPFRLVLPKFDISIDESNWLAAPLPRTPIDIDGIDIGDFSGDEQLRLRSDLTYHRCHLPEGYVPPEFDDDNGGGGGTGDANRINPPDVYIEMLNIALWEPPSSAAISHQTTPAEFHRIINTEDFDGAATYWWEVVGCNSANSPTSAYAVFLVDTAGNTYASIELPAGYPDASGQNMGRQRVQFTPPEGETTFAVLFPAYDHISVEPEGGANPDLGAVRIIVKQTNPTKTMIQIPMQCLGDWGNNYDYMAEIPQDFYDWGRYDAKSYANPAAVTADFDWCCYASVWKYNAAELATISKVVIEAAAGSPPPVVAGDDTRNFYTYAPGGEAASAWAIALFDGDGLIIEDSMAVGAGDERISFRADLELGFGTYYPKVSTDGGLNWTPYAMEWTVDHEPFGGTVAWTAFGNPWYADPWGGSTGLQFQFSWKYASGSSPESISIALFDRTAGSMVTGSEMSWAADSPVTRKRAEIDPASLVDGHEYEVRYQVGGSGGLGAIFTYESNLYIWLSPISAMTVWQRVGKSEYEDYFGRAEAPHVGDEARTLLHIPEGASVYFENCAWSWGIAGDENSEFPRLYRLFDVGETDFGIEGIAIAPSTLQWEVGDPTEVVMIKRSEALTLTDGNRFIVDQPNYEYDLFQVQAFIVIKSVI